MRYNHVVPAIFLARPNRFVAEVLLDNGKQVVCHVKNTGRCRELLIPGVQVWLEKPENSVRKTAYDLIAVQKGERLINMDSQAPNAAVKEWLAGGGLGEISQLRAETLWGASRFDFSFVREGKPCFLEVKGVTLEENGVCAFPDAPTERGTRHLKELREAVKAGYGAYVLFVIQMAEAAYLHPNDATDPSFGQALREAAENGVNVLAMDCTVTEREMTLRSPVKVVL